MKTYIVTNENTPLLMNEAELKFFQSNNYLKSNAFVTEYTNQKWFDVVYDSYQTIKGVKGKESEEKRMLSIINDFKSH